MKKQEKTRAILRYILMGRSDFIDESKKTLRFFAELFWAFLVAMIIRSFLIQPFIIPTGSMIPTILIGDFIFANKFAYGYTKHSFPMGIIPIKDRVFKKDPTYGDVILFNNPKDQGKDYVKRCVGLPGDRIQMKEGILHINGKPLSLEFVKQFPQTDPFGRVHMVKEYTETLPNGVKHPIHKYGFNFSRFDNTPEFVVPEDHFFGMGDNRDNSLDSRCPEQVGFIPGKNLLGKGWVRWMSIEDARWWAFWEWPWTIRFKRIFTSIE